MPTVHFPIREMTRNELVDAVKLLVIVGGGEIDSRMQIAASRTTWNHIVKMANVDDPLPTVLGCSAVVQDVPEGHFLFILNRPNTEPFILELSIPSEGAPTTPV